MLNFDPEKKYMQKRWNPINKTLLLSSTLIRSRVFKLCFLVFLASTRLLVDAGSTQKIFLHQDPEIKGQV